MCEWAALGRDLTCLDGRTGLDWSWNGMGGVSVR